VNNTNADISILVNTSDSFEDCWNPFFKLFSKYWLNCDYPIFLNTEFKDYQFNELNITSTKVHLGIHDRRLTWSECLIRAIEKIDSPLILYFQEDYFIDRPVDVEFVQNMVNLMVQNPTIKKVGLITTDTQGPFEESDFESLFKISQKAKYRISTQVGVWRKETLLSYLRAEENGWMFEIFGTWRSWKKQELFLTISRDIFTTHQTSPIHYIHTGIIKGKWHPEIPRIFKENGIEVNYTKRGFYDLDISTVSRKIETFKKLLASPKLLFNNLYELI
jgi:hypothetical protein